MEEPNQQISDPTLSLEQASLLYSSNARLVLCRTCQAEQVMCPDLSS